MSEEDLTIAYQLGVEDMRSRLHKQADEIAELRAENVQLLLELDMQQATILVPSQKDDQRRIERLDAELKEALDEAATVRAENEKLREALRPFVKTLAWNCTDADPDDACIDHEGALSIGDLRAAAAALKESGDE